ncbi:hypothetical protein ACM43_01685 [Bradyrhizobium sp. CCBAU 45321]|uniref:hypothetical protein n=1 Tax=Bradyrhizobium sp. CCBAU 45321 TaxID=1641878 RepID=UPI0023043A10|nr:hypothetical protein [Bradyrhizobium sp. CCBAU 45321]MDA9543280.1 hypothetical protein [Bradyrhizobium sp. CCBAU 45321]
MIMQHAIEVPSVALDSNECKRPEEALRESEERFRTLVQFSFDVYWETDAEHRFIRQEFAETLLEPPVSEIGRTRWEVPYLEPLAQAPGDTRRSPPVSRFRARAADARRRQALYFRLWAAHL